MEFLRSSERISPTRWAMHSFVGQYEAVDDDINAVVAVVVGWRNGRWIKMMGGGWKEESERLSRRASGRSGGRARGEEEEETGDGWLAGWLAGAGRLGLGWAGAGLGGGGAGAN